MEKMQSQFPDFVTTSNIVKAINSETELPVKVVKEKKEEVKSSDFRPMMAVNSSIKKVKSKVEKQYPLISQKIFDGIRVFAEIIKERVYLFRQNGNRLIYNEIEDQLEIIFERFPFLTHLDCEIYADGCNLIQTNNLLNYKNNKEEVSITDNLRNKKLKLAIYDVPTQDMTAKNRRSILSEIKTFCKEKNFTDVIVENGTIVNNDDEAFQSYLQALSENTEGITMTKPESTYKVGSKTINRIKLVHK